MGVSVKFLRRYDGLLSSMEQETVSDYTQLDFFHLLPGSAGGRALRDQRGSDYFSELARSAAARRTPQERQAIHCSRLLAPLQVRVYVLRQTMRQLLTPDELRGRMVAVGMVFFAGGPQLGELEAGVVASLVGGPLTVLLGGLACIVTVGVVAWRVGELRRYEGETKT